MSNQLQNKLLQYEAEPAAKVWDEIAASLDQGISNSISEKLYRFEAIPKKNVWEKINEDLDKLKERAKIVVPFFTRYRRPLKYTGAIAIFIFLAMFTTLFISKKTISEVPQSMNTKEKTKYVKIDSTFPLKKKNKDENSGSQTLIASTPAPKKLNRTSSGSLSRQTATSIIPHAIVPIAIQNTSSGSRISEDNYLTYIDSDGTTSRLSKKLFWAFTFPIENFMYRENIKKLQKKIAYCSFSYGFPQLLEILNNVKENQ